MTDDPVATLRALADIYRGFYRKPDAERLALAAHIEGVTERHRLDPYSRDWCLQCYGLESWPCPDVRELLAVADALGITT